MRHHLRPRTRRTPSTPAPAPETPIRGSTEPDWDLAEATQGDPKLARWVAALASSSEATMRDNVEEQLYSRAPDALTRQGIEPTPEAIEGWVVRQLHSSS